MMCQLIKENGTNQEQKKRIKRLVVLKGHTFHVQYEINSNGEERVQEHARSLLGDYFLKPNLT